ncbi:MAG: hypothetical protein Q8P25_02780 [Candidatus Curtissbacteria bacterium]|nr:hypothetical protein [Candidatus Curtissbacteria bacterium]
MAVGYFAVKRVPKPTYTPPLEQTSSSSPKADLKTVQSSTIKFSVKIPVYYNVEEKIGSMIISSSNGEIYIDKNGTNFDDLESYVKDLSQKNKFNLVDKKNLVINGLPSISGKVGEEKNYFIYKTNTVYTLSAKSEKLHSTLDQIAQSFRYTP